MLLVQRDQKAGERHQRSLSVPSSSARLAKTLAPLGRFRLACSVLDSCRQRTPDVLPCTSLPKPAPHQLQRSWKGDVKPVGAPLSWDLDPSAHLPRCLLPAELDLAEEANRQGQCSDGKISSKAHRTFVRLKLRRLGTTSFASSWVSSPQLSQLHPLHQSRGLSTEKMERGPFHVSIEMPVRPARELEGSGEN